MNNGRAGYTIRNTDVMRAIDQILFESPDLKNNLFFMHQKQVIAEIEDEGERAPPLAALFEDEVIDILGLCGDSPGYSDAFTSKSYKSLIPSGVSLSIFPPHSIL